MDHFWHMIDGWFDDRDFGGIYREAVRRAPADKRSVFVEVGAWKGRSTAYMAVEIANSGKPIEFYVIDTWDGSDELEHMKDLDCRDGRLFSVFCENMARGGVLDLIYPVRMKSVIAAKLFGGAKTPLFVFLDGSHEFEDVSSEIHEFVKRMHRLGAVIGGHDYDWPGVRQAVDAVAVPEVRKGSWLVGGWSTGEWK